MYKNQHSLLLLLLLVGLCRPALAVFPDFIPTPEISMAEAVERASVELKSYLEREKIGPRGNLIPLQANYIWRTQQMHAYGQKLTDSEIGIWEVMFASTPSAPLKVYVYIRRGDKAPVIFTLYH